MCVLWITTEEEVVDIIVCSMNAYKYVDKHVDKYYIVQTECTLFYYFMNVNEAWLLV